MPENASVPSSPSHGPVLLERGQLAPSTARRLVAEWLGGTPGTDCLDAAQLVVSELVTNAVKHGHGDITLCIALQRDALLIEVSDQRTDRIPMLELTARDGDGGHGLHLVAELSDAWGWSADGTSKVVWALVAAPPA